MTGAKIQGFPVRCNDFDEKKKGMWKVFPTLTTSLYFGREMAVGIFHQ